VVFEEVYLVLILEIMDHELLEDVSRWRPVVVTGIVL